jgi:hypothetical protein
MTTKALRGQIDFLYKIYPEYAEELTIISVFYQYYRESEIKKSLQYLVDKNYSAIEITEHPVYPRKKIKMYKILPAGVDLLEGNIVDDTVLTDGE